MSFEFYLGTHRPAWLKRVDVPLFISARQLSLYRTPPRATCRWALDSGGFSELTLHGRWTKSPLAYALDVLRWSQEVGGLEWAAIQDWMVEPQILARTGLDVAEHQRRTIDNYERLLSLVPDFPWCPVLQGWEADDYLRHADDYADRGHDLAFLPRVGVGSICRRQKSSDVEMVLRRLHAAGVKIHAFGFKRTGLQKCADVLASSDSMAWSFHARKNPGINPHHPHTNCANCMEYALQWRADLLEGLCPTS